MLVAALHVSRHRYQRSHVLRCWDVSTGRVVATAVTRHSDTIASLSLPFTCRSECGASGGSDVPAVAAASWDGGLSVWDLYTLSHLCSVMDAHTGGVIAVAALPGRPSYLPCTEHDSDHDSDRDSDRVLLATAGAVDGLVRLWALQKDDAVDVSSDGCTVGDGHPRDVLTMVGEVRVAIGDNNVVSLTPGVHPATGRDELLAVCSNGSVVVVDVAASLARPAPNRRRAHSATDPTAEPAVSCLSSVFPRDRKKGTLLRAVGLCDGTIRVVDVGGYTSSGAAAHGAQRCVVTLRGHRGKITGLAGLHDPASGYVLLASGSVDSSARLWDVNTGSCLRVWDGHFHGIALQFRRGPTPSPSPPSVGGAVAGDSEGSGVPVRDVVLVSGGRGCSVREWNVFTAASRTSVPATTTRKAVGATLTTAALAFPSAWKFEEGCLACDRQVVAILVDAAVEDGMLLAVCQTSNASEGESSLDSANKESNKKPSFDVVVHRVVMRSAAQADTGVSTPPLCAGSESQCGGTLESSCPTGPSELEVVRLSGFPSRVTALATVPCGGQVLWLCGTMDGTLSLWATGTTTSRAEVNGPRADSAPCSATGVRIGEIGVGRNAGGLSVPSPLGPVHCVVALPDDTVGVVFSDRVVVLGWAAATFAHTATRSQLLSVIPAADLLSESVLGRGSFGTVHRAWWRSRGMTVAVKTYSHVDDNVGIEAKVFDALVTQPHPYIVFAYGKCGGGGGGSGPASLVLELCREGRLSSYLRTVGRRGKVSARQRCL